jgi:prepilin-type N-terminal cleavage/methylation domain-containing protein
MIAFKNHKAPGFTFIEIVFALAILASLGTAILVLQSQSINTIARYSQKLVRIFLLENTLVETQEALYKQQKPAAQKKIENPATTVTYKAEKPSEKSALASVKNIVVERIEATWQDGQQQHKERLVSIRYQPPPKEEQEGQKSGK